MILVETLVQLVRNYLDDLSRPGSTGGDVSAQELVDHLVRHLAEQGVDIGFRDGTRFTVAASTSRQPEPGIAAGVTDVEVVIAHQLNAWSAEPLHAARRYAEGLVAGTISPVADLADWDQIAAALGHAAHEEHLVDGFRWRLDAEAWQVGIGSIHGLAHGVVECAETGEQYGVPTDVHVSWFVYSEDLEGTDLTVGDLATAFSGDLMAAAAAFLRAYDVMTCR